MTGASLKLFYKTCCEPSTDELPPYITLADKDGVTDDFIKKVFKGELKDGQIHQDYYFDVAKKLGDAIAKGLGAAQFKSTDNRNALAAHLQHNIFAFSAAKTSTAMQEFKKALITETGEPATFSQFRNKAIAVGETFNNAHLKTEYNNAMATAQMGAKWQKLQKYSHLKYRTVGDKRVRPDHDKLNNKVFATNDPIWDEIYPPNGWNCRCTVIPAQGATADNYTDEVKEGKKIIALYFKRNAGKERVVFTNNHPMMARLIKDDNFGNPSELQAVKHYNLKSVDQIYKSANLPEYNMLKSQEAAIEWYEKHSKGGFEVAAKDGISVKLDQSFFDKIVKTGSDKYAGRYVYAHKAPEVLQQPDEVWSHMHKGQLQNIYIKYYKDKPLMMAVKENNGVMQFETFHELDEATIFNKRKGVLKFRK